MWLGQGKRRESSGNGDASPTLLLGLDTATRSLSGWWREGGLQAPGWETLCWAPDVSGSRAGRHPASSPALISVGPGGLNSPPRGRGRVGGCLDMGRGPWLGEGSGLQPLHPSLGLSPQSCPVKFAGG